MCAIVTSMAYARTCAHNGICTMRTWRRQFGTGVQQKQTGSRHTQAGKQYASTKTLLRRSHKPSQAHSRTTTPSKQAVKARDSQLVPEAVANKYHEQMFKKRTTKMYGQGMGRPGERCRPLFPLGKLVENRVQNTVLLDRDKREISGYNLSVRSGWTNASDEGPAEWQGQGRVKSKREHTGHVQSGMRLSHTCQQ